MAEYHSVYTGQQVDEAVSKANTSVQESSIVQVKGGNTDKVMSQSAVTGALNLLDNSKADTSDLTELTNLISQKPNALNSHSDSTTDTYSAHYSNANFASVGLMVDLYASKTSTNSATLTPDKPNVATTNILTSTGTTNTNYNWELPDFTFVRTLESETILANTSLFSFDLAFKINRNAVISWGAKVKASTNNGTSWTDISDNQAFTAKSYNADIGITETLMIYTNAISGRLSFPAGTYLKVEIYKKQEVATALTTDVYCGVEVDGANIFSSMRFNFSNVNINTNQISDGAVTKEKLSTAVQSTLDSVQEKQDKYNMIRFDTGDNVINNDDHTNIFINGGSIKFEHTSDLHNIKTLFIKEGTIFNPSTSATEIVKINVDLTEKTLPYTVEKSMSFAGYTADNIPLFTTTSSSSGETYYADDNTLELYDNNGEQTFKVKNLGIDTTQIKDSAVTSDKIAQAFNQTLVHTTGDETISGVKTFNDNIKCDTFENKTPNSPTRVFNTNAVQLQAGSDDVWLDSTEKSVFAGTDNTIDLGKTDKKFKDLYLTGVIYGGTNKQDKYDFLRVDSGTVVDINDDAYTDIFLYGGTINFSSIDNFKNLKSLYVSGNSSIGKTTSGTLDKINLDFTEQQLPYTFTDKAHFVGYTQNNCPLFISESAEKNADNLSEDNKIAWRTALDVPTQATSTKLGIIKAEARDTAVQTKEVKIDTTTGKLYSEAGGSGGSANAVEYVEQSLTDAQKQQARINIEAMEGIDFKTASWEEINIIAEAGLGQQYFNVGDEKTITLTDSTTNTTEDITLQILGFNHDDLADGTGKANITFGMKNLLATTYKMNDTNTNVGGWGGYDEATANVCKMRTTTMPEYYNKLPADLQSAIKTVDKKTTAGNMLTDIKTSHDKLFLFSRVEVFPNITQAGYVGEGTQYEYWNKHNTNADRIKKLSNGTSNASWWWLRSPNSNGTVDFGSIYSDGYYSTNNASSVGGVCFGFCIGHEANTFDTLITRKIQAPSGTADNEPITISGPAMEFNLTQTGDSNVIVDKLIFNSGDSTQSPSIFPFESNHLDLGLETQKFKNVNTEKLNNHEIPTGTAKLVDETNLNSKQDISKFLRIDTAGYVLDTNEYTDIFIISGDVTFNAGFDGTNLKTLYINSGVTLKKGTSPMVKINVDFTEHSLDPEYTTTSKIFMAGRTTLNCPLFCSISPVSEICNVPANSWVALTDKTPFTFSANVTLTTPLTDNSILELIDDNAILFANHGFAIGTVSGQVVTLYALSQPTVAVDFTLLIGGK